MPERPRISMIAAMSENRVIGRNNRLPWDIPEDLNRFREITRGHPVIMGRKTYESIGRLLPERLNIIITRDPNYKVEGAIVTHKLTDAIVYAESKERREIFIIGGAEIFAQAMSIADKLYLTIIHAAIEGDTFFPDYSRFQTEIARQDSSNEKYQYTFIDLIP